MSHAADAALEEARREAAEALRKPKSVRFQFARDWSQWVSLPAVRKESDLCIQR